MKNRSLVSGMLALALVFGLVLAGCSDDPLEVVGSYNAAHGPSIDASTITVFKDTAPGANDPTNDLYVSFTTVAGATSYLLYAKNETSGVYQFNSYATIGFAYTSVGGATASPSWSDQADGAYDSTKAHGTVSVPKGTWYIGVQSRDELSNIGAIQWSATAYNAY
jgi:hypothetical protein